MKSKSNTSKPVIRYLLSGKLTRSTVATSDGRVFIDQPAGSVLFAAGGLGLWDSPVGLLSTVGNDYPEDWLERISSRGFDIEGIRRLPDDIDQRHFAAYDADGNVNKMAPVSIFLKLEIPFPQNLLGFSSTDVQLDSRNRPGVLTLRPGDIPTEFFDATAAHFCPSDFLTQSLVPGILRQGQIQTITIDPSPGYMNKVFFDEISQVITGITAFLPSEEEVYSLFEGKTRDLRDISIALASHGCEFVVIKRGGKGVLVYEHVTHTFWDIPAYPVQVIDPTGVGDAFCGGFLAGLRMNYDPFEAALMGSVSASFKIQGNGPFFTLDALPELAKARIDILREKSSKG